MPEVVKISCPTDTRKDCSIRNWYGWSKTHTEYIFTLNIKRNSRLINRFSNISPQLHHTKHLRHLTCATTLVSLLQDAEPTIRQIAHRKYKTAVYRKYQIQIVQAIPKSLTKSVLFLISKIPLRSTALELVWVATGSESQSPLTDWS